MRSCRFGGIFESDPDENSEHSLHDSCKQVNCTSKNSPYAPRSSGSPSLLQPLLSFPRLRARNPFIWYFPQFSCGFPSNSMASFPRFPWPLLLCGSSAPFLLRTLHMLDPGLDSPSTGAHPPSPLVLIQFPVYFLSWSPPASCFLDHSSPVYFTCKLKRFLCC